MTTLREAAQQALEFIRWSQYVPCQSEAFLEPPSTAPQVEAALRAALAEPVQEPVAWIPIEQIYPQPKAIDILMGDGSILCAVLPQFDGDLWWEGSGTGEKFIDPKYANVTHWRIHGEHTAPPQRKPLTEEEIAEASAGVLGLPHEIKVELARAIERAHGIGDSDE